MQSFRGTYKIVLENFSYPDLLIVRRLSKRFRYTNIYSASTKIKFHYTRIILFVVFEAALLIRFDSALTFRISRIWQTFFSLFTSEIRFLQCATFSTPLSFLCSGFEKILVRWEDIPVWNLWIRQRTNKSGKVVLKTTRSFSHSLHFGYKARLIYYEKVER